MYTHLQFIMVDTPIFTLKVIMADSHCVGECMWEVEAGANLC